jgi:putative transposase
MSAGEVKHDIVDYIEMFYNSQRLHSFSDYLNPNDFERELLSLNRLSVFT